MQYLIIVQIDVIRWSPISTDLDCEGDLHYMCLHLSCFNCRSDQTIVSAVKYVCAVLCKFFKVIVIPGVRLINMLVDIQVSSFGFRYNIKTEIRYIIFFNLFTALINSLINNKIRWCAVNKSYSSNSMHQYIQTWVQYFTI